MQGKRRGLTFVSDAMDVIGQQRNHVAVANLALFRRLKFGEVGIAAVVQTPPVDIDLNPFNADNHAPGLMVVRRDTASGQPGHGFYQNGMIRLLVQDRDPHALLFVAFKILWP